MHQRRDTQAVVVEDDPLLADEFGRALNGGERDAAVDAGEMAETVPARLVQRDRATGGEHVLHRRDVQ